MHNDVEPIEEGDELSPIVIDLGAHRKGEVTESWLRGFGWAIEKVMGRMFGGASVPVKVKGTRTEVDAFAKALGGEKKYMKTAAQYGLNDPRTYKDKFKLRKNVSQFERKTGLKWPFKD